MKRLFMALFFLFAMALVLLVVGFLGLGFYLSPQDELIKADAIVAISGGETRSRALKAIHLYEEGWSPRIIFSGAALDQNSPSNAAAMRLIAVEEGVPANDILIEEESANTNQNAVGVAQIIQQNDYKKIILVTSPYHQRRASIAFEHALGSSVGVINHSTTDQNWRRSRWWDGEYSKALTLGEFQKTLYLLWLNTGTN